MTDDHNDRDDREEPSDDHWLSTLLSALASLESGADDERRTTGRRRGDRSVIDYDISIRSGDDLGDVSEDDLRRGRTPFTRDDGDGSGDRSSSRDDGRDRRRRTRRTRSSVPSSEHRVAIRRYDDELLVTADVGGVDPAEVTVGFDDSTLVIGVSGSEIDRIDVPRDWGDRESRATIKNGVLTVQIEPESEDEKTAGEEASTDEESTASEEESTDEESTASEEESTDEESMDENSTASEDDHE